jgi:hypothetical protein
MGKDLREDPAAFEASLEGQGRLLTERMGRAKDYQKELRHYVVWADPLLARALTLQPWGLPAGEDPLVAMVRAHPDTGRQFQGPGGGLFPAQGPPRLEPLVRRTGKPTEIIYTSAGGGLQLSLAELDSMGRLLFDEAWIRLLFTSPPLDQALDLGLAADTRHNTVAAFVTWLQGTTRSGWPDYAAACFDLFCVGVAIRSGHLPRKVEMPNAKDLLEAAERERERAQAWQRAHLDEERARWLQASAQKTSPFAVPPPAEVDPALKAKLQAHVPPKEVTELSDATKPRKLSLDERETAAVRSALKKHIRAQELRKALEEPLEQVAEAYAAHHMQYQSQLPAPRRRVPMPRMPPGGTR